MMSSHFDIQEPYMTKNLLSVGGGSPQGQSSLGNALSPGIPPIGAGSTANTVSFQSQFRHQPSLSVNSINSINSLNSLNSFNSNTSTSIHDSACQFGGEPLTPPEIANNSTKHFSPWNTNNNGALNNNSATQFPAQVFPYSNTTGNPGVGAVPPVASTNPRSRLLSLPQLQPAVTFNIDKSLASLSLQNNTNLDTFNPTSSSTTPIYPKKSHEKELVTRLNSTPFEVLTDEIVSLSKDQYGCRFLQRKLDENSTLYFPIIFGQICAHASELMVDPFGNYLVQKLLNYCTNHEKDLLLEQSAPELFSVALNQHGTRALQKIIDCLGTNHQFSIVRDSLKNHVVELIQDLNGNHVVQKCINKFSHKDFQFIIDAICLHIVRISTHKHGCCVLQKCLNKCNQQQLVQLGDEIIANAIVLMKDQFGNYVVQYLLSMNNLPINEKLVYQILPSISMLSVQKFSSNVMEKCLKNAPNRSSQNAMLEEILRPQNLNALIKDQYGNYVVQTAIDVADDEYKFRLIQTVKPMLPFIKSTPYSRRIQSKISVVLNQNANLNSMLTTYQQYFASTAAPDQYLSFYKQQQQQHQYQSQQFQGLHNDQN
ncbi:BA75_00465T0 [Komagataella pastoris]|uniref:BA75_00465T0 n=1 Tax=Komagataella pastoris TaxID=4922 RepID=A0A1B2J662_PICPA|nr:BA75_00465T0 [Komagataella pastoris]